MNAQKRSSWVVVALVITGIIGLTAHSLARRRAEVARTDSFWRLHYGISFESEERGASLRIYVPRDTAGVRVFRQDLHSPRLEIDQAEDIKSEARFVLVRAPAHGEYRLDLRFDLHLHVGDPSVGRLPGPESPGGGSESGLESSGFAVDIDAEVIANVAEELGRGSSTVEQQVQRYFRYCRSAHHDDGGVRSDSDRIFRQHLETLSDRNAAMVALCRAAGISVRRVTGFVIERTRYAEPQVWLETRVGDRWIACDLRNGTWDSLPRDYLAVRRGETRLIERHDVSEVECEFSISQLSAAPEEEVTSNRSVFASIFDLTRLPLQMHDVVAIILLMPLGALVTCIFRNLIGIETSGRFTPMLLALSFIFADWHTGLIVFTTVVILGLATRTLVEPLKLLMLPRLSIILTLVVWCLVFGVSALAYLDLTPGPHAVLLPMVILTMIVERFYVSAQEDGTAVAVRRLAGTIVVGFFCYLVLRWELVAQLLLAYPEAHLITLAVLIVIGRYTGYRLVELWRFRDMAEVPN